VQLLTSRTLFVARNVPCQLCDIPQDGGDRHVVLVLNSRDPSLQWADDESDCVCRAGFDHVSPAMHGSAGLSSVEELGTLWT
jgi:hypothetical protein